MLSLARTTAALACTLALGLTAAHARQERQKQPDPAAETSRPPHVNTKPFNDLAERGRVLVEQGRLGPETTFDLTATGELGEDGRLKPETVKVVWRETPNEEVKTFAQQWLMTLNESEALASVRGAKAVRLDARLGRENVSLGLEAELVSVEEARKFATGFDALLVIGRHVKQGTPEGTLYEAIKVSFEGKAFRLVFEMPKAEAARMVAEMLDKRAGHQQN